MKKTWHDLKRYEATVAIFRKRKLIYFLNSVFHSDPHVFKKWLKNIKYVYIQALLQGTLFRPFQSANAASLNDLFLKKKNNQSQTHCFCFFLFRGKFPRHNSFQLWKEHATMLSIPAWQLHLRLCPFFSLIFNISIFK